MRRLTPIVLLLENSVVRDAAEGKAAVALMPDWDVMTLLPDAGAE